MSQVAIVFPGQGSQHIGMAEDFVRMFPESREVFQQASLVLGFDMPTVCFFDGQSLDQTQFTQPAILTAEIAMFRAFKKISGIIPSYFAGHSLGEYSALVAAEALPFEDALRIVAKRGALMARAVPEGEGAMVAIIHEDLASIPYQEVLAQEGVEVANINSPSQVVASGSRSGIKSASDRLTEKFPAIQLVPLNVSAPFHCRMMKSIEREFEHFLRSFEGKINKALASKVISNFSGTFHRPDKLVDDLVRQISGCVNWMGNMQALLSATQSIFEIGPSRVLGKFFGRVGASVSSITDIRSMRKNLPAQRSSNGPQRE